LAEFDPRKERIVALRYFGGLTIEEAAEVVCARLNRVRRPFLNQVHEVLVGAQALNPK